MAGTQVLYSQYCLCMAICPVHSRRRGLTLDNLSGHRRKLCSLYWVCLSKAILFCTVRWLGLDVLSSTRRFLIYRHRSTSHSVLIMRLVAVRGFSSMPGHQLVALYLSCQCIHSLSQATTFRRRGTYLQTRNLNSRLRCRWMAQSTSRARPELWLRCS